MHTFDSDKPLTVFGVPGRLTHRTTSAECYGHRWFKQRWISERRPVSGYGRGAVLRVKIRFDDELRNGHNTFAITGDIDGPARKVHGHYTRPEIAGGCLHDEIAQVFPELAPLIKWHLMNSDGPMHCPGNVLYLAGNRDCWGNGPGDVSRYSYGIRFDNVPITHRVSKALHDYLKARIDNKDQIDVEPIEHPREPETYGAHWTPLGFTDRWARCPWKDETEAHEMFRALNNCKVSFFRVPIEYSKGKARELDAARRAAIWPEATDAELSAPRDELRAKLIERLPALIREFRETIEKMEFYWTPEDYAAETEAN